LALSRRALVLLPFGGRPATAGLGMHLTTQIGGLPSRGSRIETIFPVYNAEHMFGANVMDPALRPAAARAGYDQGRALTEHLTEFWR
jgi:NTE family protein